MQTKNKLTIDVYFIFILIGLSKNIIGPVLPAMIDNYKISLAMAGMVMAFLSTGRVFSLIAATVWLDSVKRKHVLVTGTGLMTLGLFGYGLSIWWWGHLVSILLVGIGIGLVGSSGNALIADLYPQRRGKALNRLHMFFGIGSLLGPILAGVFFTFDIPMVWKLIISTTACISLAIFVYTFILKFPETRKNVLERENIKSKVSKQSLDLRESADMNSMEANDVNLIDENAVDANKIMTVTDKSNSEWKEDFLKERIKKLVHSPLFYIMGIVVFIYIGIGNGIIGWINKYLTDMMAFSTFAASAVLAGYNIGITSGRLVCSFIAEHLGYKRTILFCSIGALLTISTAVLSTNVVLIVAGFGLTGFFIAGIYPTIVAYGTDLFPEMVGTITSALTTVAAMGGILIPWFMGFVSEYFGLQGGMYVSIVFAIFLVITASFIGDDKELLGKSVTDKQDSTRI